MMFMMFNQIEKNMGILIHAFHMKIISGNFSVGITKIQNNNLSGDHIPRPAARELGAKVYTSSVQNFCFRFYTIALVPL